jgi:Protein of unknown function (DUF3574)
VRRAAPVLLLLLAACSGVVLYEHAESDTLYFGTAKPDGSVVTAAEWQQFLREEVTPRFPGFTHWEAHGSWKDVPEESHVLQLVHEPGREADVLAIIDAYKKRFAQEAVLQVRSDVWLRLR